MLVFLVNISFISVYFLKKTDPKIKPALKKSLNLICFIFA